MPHTDHTGKESKHLSRNEQFLRKVRETVDSNLSNEQFGVEDLARSMAMSRVQLYRKIHKLTGKNISQYIREFRLERAMELLKEDVAGVAEIAYRVGFGSPAYFNKCFHDYYGYPPGKVIKTLEEEENKSIINVEMNEPDRKPNRSVKRIIYTSLSAVILVSVIGFLLIRQASIFNDPVKKKSIAVLPIRCLSEGPEKQYLADGVMDAITAYLSRIKGLRIIPRTSLEQYKDKAKTIPDITRDLKVQYLLESSFQLYENNVRLTVQLINTSDGSQLWVRQYDREWKDIFNVQSEVAQTIADEIKVILTPGEKQEIQMQATTDLTAYDYYLRGNDYYNRSNRETDLRFAIQMYQKAIELDSTFTLAWVGLAASSRFLYFDYHDRSRENLQKTKQYLDQALKLAPLQVEVKLEEAKYYYHCKREYDTALKILDNLRSKYPLNAEIYYWAGCVYKRTGDFNKALDFHDQATKLNPVNWQLWNSYGLVFHFTGQYDEAEKCYQKSIDLNPSAGFYINLINLYHVKGDTIKLNEILNNPQLPYDSLTIAFSYDIHAKLHESRGSYVVSSVNQIFSNHLVSAQLYYLRGNKKMAAFHFEKERIFLEERLKEETEDSRIHRYLGIVYAGLGNEEKAIEYGRKAIELYGLDYDAMEGSLSEIAMARILMMLGRYDEAIQKLEFLLDYSGWVSIESLKRSIIWKPFHENEKFKQLLSNPEYQQSSSLPQGDPEGGRVSE
jgi:TolB-like protein/AraC-like DNA-binding protein